MDGLKFGEIRQFRLKVDAWERMTSQVQISGRTVEVGPVCWTSVDLSSWTEQGKRDDGDTILTAVGVLSGVEHDSIHE